MNYDVSQWSIVLVGSWNTALLNPDWMANHMFDGEQAEVDINVVPGRRALMRVRRGSIMFAPTEERVTIHCTEASEEAVLLAEQKAVALLRLLPVTPVSAVGVNFGFEEAEPEGSLLRCLIPWFDGAIHSLEWKEALWDKFVTAAPRPRTPSEQQYSDRKLRPRR